MPYFGYSKQDRKAKHWEPITAKLVANLITSAGADGVLTMDLHAQQTQGFFDIPVDILYASKVLVNYFAKKKIKKGVVVAPDVGASKRARSYAKRLGFDLAIVDKRRPKPNVSKVMHVIGDVKGKTAVLVDDEINTAGTMVNAAEALMKMGAKDVYAAASHAVFAGHAVEKLGSSPIKEVVVTDSIPVPKEKQFPKLKVVSVAGMFAEAIGRIHKGVSVSKMLNPAD
jgi:ribose-phosphate pyrophosphokinase